jgi:phosphatidylglycerol lysyltransferase
MKQRWIFWLLIIAFVWVVVSRFTEAEKLVQTLRQGRWAWVLVAVLIQAVYYIVFSLSYQAAFRTVEVNSRLRDLVPVTLSSLFVNVVAPMGGAGGAALFVDDAARRGQPPGRAAAGVLLQLILDYSAFALILISGLLYLFARHDLQLYEVIGAAILLALTLVLGSVLLLGLWRPTRLEGVLSWLQRLVNRLGNRFHRPEILRENWAAENAVEFNQASAAVSAHPIGALLTLGAALLAHILDIACLFVIFLAFGYTITAGPLVAGYAMGILFWIVSITPQGIGVVEGVMTLVFTSLGVPSEIATTVSLVFRGLTFWIPLLLGAILIRRVKSFSTSNRVEYNDLSVQVVAALTAIMGGINLFSAIMPALMGRVAVLERFSPVFVRHGGRIVSALAGFALLLLARQLWRRKRVAWLLTIIILLVSAVSHLLKGLDYEEALLSLGLALWLWFLRPKFHARSDRPSIQQGLMVLVMALGFSLAYGTIGFYLLDRHFSVNFDLIAAVHQTWVMFTQFYNPGLEPITGYGRYFAASIYVIGFVTLGYAAFMVVRPVLLRKPSSEVERMHAEKIIRAYGRSSLARLALFEDKAYYFSPGGSVVAYTVKRRVAVALGDPIGPDEDITSAIHGFQSFCTLNDWISAFFQTLPDHLQGYQAMGFDLLCIGNDAIVELDQFTLEGGTNKGLRSAYNRFTKLRYTAEVLQPPLSAELLTQLSLISDEWLTSMHGTEKRFSLGWFHDAYIRECPVMVVRDPDQNIVAFANLVTEYNLNEITIDLMRHKRQVVSGTMDFLFVSLLHWAREQGYATFNLGLSALSGVGEKPGDPALERALNFVYEHVNRFYNFKGLHEFKEKFHPTWSPRYLIYPRLMDLAVVWLAVTQANSGIEDFPWGYFQRKPLQNVGTKASEVQGGS